MKTKEEAIEKAGKFLANLPSGWIYFTYQVGFSAPGIPDAPEAGEWFFTLVKGPVTLFPRENCTKWVARIGKQKGEISGPWETEQECVTIKGALQQEGEALQKFTEQWVSLLLIVNEVLQGTGVGDENK